MVSSVLIGLPIASNMYNKSSTTPFTSVRFTLWCSWSKTILRLILFSHFGIMVGYVCDLVNKLVNSPNQDVNSPNKDAKWQTKICKA